MAREHRERGVRTVKSAPEGLYAICDNKGLATCFMVAWEDVPYDVRQHLAEVYKYMNQENDKRIESLAVNVRDKKILDHDLKGWGT